MNKLTVGQMAKLNNISTQALRMYDKMGLLKPQIIDDGNGYRYYDIRQSACLDMIQYMKSLGMTLKDIKEQLDMQDMNIINEILMRRKADIDNQIKELTITKSAIKKSY